MSDRRKVNYSQFDDFQAAIAKGGPNDWRCRAGSRYLYICEDGLVHYCSQQRGYPGVPLAEYTTADVKREFLTAKSCAPQLHHRLRPQDQLHRPLARAADQHCLPGRRPASLVNIHTGDLVMQETRAQSKTFPSHGPCRAYCGASSRKIKSYSNATWIQDSHT